MDARQRRELTRYGAPAAFLAAVTIAVLLIKAGLTGDNRHTTTGQELPTTRPATTRAARTQRTAARIYYVIRTGDTLSGIAFSHHTTVDGLLRLNPGIDPHALRAGMRIRVH